MNAYCFLASPIGRLLLCSNGHALTGLYMELAVPDRMITNGQETASVPPLREAVRQLTDYFTGTRRHFELPLDLQGTPFQQRVWNALLRIPYGETRTYGDVARAIGNLAACRAVGLANGRNPISVIVPCHRVIGADGSLTGFGGGLPRKQWLLSHEASPALRTLELPG